MTKQIIQIEVSHDGWKKLKLSNIIQFIACECATNDLTISRLEVKEVKNKKGR